MHSSVVCVCSFFFICYPHTLLAPHVMAAPGFCFSVDPLPLEASGFGYLGKNISVQDSGFATGSLDVSRLSLPGSLHIGPHGRVEAQQPAPGMSKVRCLPLNRPCGKSCSCPRAEAESSKGRNKQVQKSRVTWGSWPCCFHSHPVSYL